MPTNCPDPVCRFPVKGLGHHDYHDHHSPHRALLNTRAATTTILRNDAGADHVRNNQASGFRTGIFVFHLPGIVRNT